MRIVAAINGSLPLTSTDVSDSQPVELSNSSVTNMIRRIELLANIGIIVVVCLLAVVLTKNYLIGVPPDLTKVADAESVGTKLSIPGIKLSSSGKTLVLALSTTCHFCTESAPFYKRLVENKHGARLVAVLPQSVDEGVHYLANLGVAVDEVKQVSLSTIDVRGAPTLMLVNSDGLLINTWVGKLAAQEESVVLASLRTEESKIIRDR